jgi:hypothetical protein
MARLAYRLALASPAMRLDLIDASLFVDRALSAGVRSVPAWRINDKDAPLAVRNSEAAMVAFLLAHHGAS